MPIKSIAEIIRGRTLYHVAATATLAEACALLDAHDIGALVVVERGEFAGLLSERDVIRRCIARGLRTQDTPVSAVMTRDPVTVDGRQPLARAMELMMFGGFRHLPVTRAGEVVGMISMRDIPTEYRLMAERFRSYTEVRAAAE